MGAFRPSIITSSRSTYYNLSHTTFSNFQENNKRISNLIRTGRLKDARRLFDEMPQKNVVTWNSMITGYIQSRGIIQARKLFDEMPERDVVSWNLMISGYISCCGTRQIEESRDLFDRMPERDYVSWNTMISGYARNKRMKDAAKLFDKMPDRNVVSWNAMITGFLQNGDVQSAINMFKRMPVRDSISLSTIVSGLIRNDKLDEAVDFLVNLGKMEIEGDALDAYNTLIAGYGQRGRVDEARKLFDQIPSKHNPFREDSRKIKISGKNQAFERNIVSWNSMIMSYVKTGDIFSARELFEEMPERDLVSWNTMLNAYVQVGNLEEAASLFTVMPEHDVRSWNSMILGYARKGELGLAQDFFDKMPQKSLVSWNSLIAGYEQNGEYESAIELFVLMQEIGEKPDHHTLSSILSACAGLVGLYQGMQIHQRVVKTVIADIPINNSLITMYARCGSIRDARAIFDEMGMKRDVVSWNAMIGGYGQHGFAGEALKLFQEMKRMKVEPTHITFISVLNACDHAGLTIEGQRQFDSMVHEFGIAPKVEHFASLVDIICRNGNLKEAVELIKRMPVEPDRSVWGSLLGACRVHNDVDIARIAAEELMRLDPESSAPYVLLHNMYVDVGKWDDATKLRMRMEREGIRKQPGYSWIELLGRIHVFIAGDQNHPNAEEIHNLIESYNIAIKNWEFETLESFS